MCGIVGYIGTEQAAPIILDGLSKLEYRGYDSAGMAIFDGEKINTRKAVGRLKVLENLTHGGENMKGTSGIGHTRWATHGAPSDINSHPHMNNAGTIAVVHNGIIENYIPLKKKMQDKGYQFVSETDTEVLAHLLDYYYKGNPLEAITKVLHRVEGSYALGIMFADQPDKIFAARKDSPLIIGKSENGSLIASDVPAILDQTRRVYYIGNLEIAELSRDEIHFYNIDREEIEKDVVEIQWDAAAAEKGGYEHFMLKEIHEQPKAVQDTIGAYVKEGHIDFSETGLTDEKLASLKRIYIIACGSAYHVGMVGKYVIESMAKIPVEVDVASEFRYRDPILVEDSMVVIISQSGETADSLAALRLARDRNVPVLSVVNVVGSSIARESDYTLYTYAGPEISVATTKAYSTQLIAMYLLAIQSAFVQEKLEEGKVTRLLAEMETLPDKISRVLDDKERIQWFAAKQANARDAFFIGRGIDYAISMEGSLKMKEVSYVHTEAYAAGELKHGTISLIEEGTLVVALATQPALFEKTVSNMVECKSRGAYLMGLTTYGHYNIEDTADFTVYIPKTDPHFATSLAVIPLQLLGYYVSVAKGLDVDKPRNLAKSVTVE